MSQFFSPRYRLYRQWVEVFDCGLRDYVFEALLDPEGVELALGVLDRFVHRSQLREAALRCAGKGGP